MGEILSHHLPSLLIGQYPNGPLGGLALTLILFNAAWYLYLEKSRRVRATYGLESLPRP